MKYQRLNGFARIIGRLECAAHKLRAVDFSNTITDNHS